MGFIRKLKGLDTTCKIFNFQGMWLIDKLLLNMRKQCIKTVPSEVFYLWLLAWRQQLIHSFLISVNTIFSWVFWSIHGFPCCSETAHFILPGVIFSATKAFYNINGLIVILKCPAELLGRVQDFSLMVTTHNSTALKENGITEYISFYFSLVKTFFVFSH